jgi:8-oxo-dGTP pyrophosphatase MutT (NUDIX family)
MRDASAGLEVLLLRRNSRAGFVPETYVFPGGRVDASDAREATLARVDGPSVSAAADRLSLHDADPPAIAYYLAAIREAFEETGILVGSLADGSTPPCAAEDTAVDRIRDDLMEDRIDFAEALRRMDARGAGGALAYFAHWITPRREPRRFDTRFFAAGVDARCTPMADPREMTEALWITPTLALERWVRGDLPMIRPTVWTLEELTAYSATREAIEALSIVTVVTILPGG